MKPKCILIIFLILIVSFNLTFSQKKNTISGYVSDSNGEMIIGATIYSLDDKVGTISNQYGFFSMTLNPGNKTLIVSSLGYKTDTIKILLNENVNLNIKLETEVKKIEEVIITSKKSDDNIQKPNLGIVSIQPKTIKSIPVVFGESDLLKSIQLLPGVQSGVEGMGSFYVRGGNSDQNLIILDEAVVYNPNHLFGFFSVFNTDVIKNVELYKGGIPAEYGGRLSSVLDIRTKEGNLEKIKGEGGIGLISSRLAIEGPIIKNRASFIVSGRRTYADLMLPFASDTNARKGKFYFYDLNAKINYIINDKNRIFISGYFGRDVNRFAQTFKLNYGNATITFRWNHIFSPKYFSNLTLLFSNYNYVFGVPQGVTGFLWNSTITSYMLKNDHTIYLSSKNTLKFGLQTLYYNLHPATIRSEIESVISEFKISNNYALEHAIYLSHLFKTDNFNANIGLRFTFLQNIGSATVYKYDQNYNVYDTLKYPAGKIFNHYINIEPRVSLSLIINEKNSIKFGYNRVSQNIHLASNSTANFPLDIWFLSGINVKPQLADQISLGYFKNLFNDKIESSIEVYYKKINNSIDFKDHAQLTLNPYLEGEIRTGYGYSYGIELMLRKNTGNLNGWISYSYCRAFRKINDINNNKAYPAPFDKPHNFSIVLSYKISEKIDLSTNWVYSSAIPVTVPIGGYYYKNTWIPYFSDRNSVRIPGTEYHRLDLSINIKHKIFKLDGGTIVSVYNAYNRHNAYAVYFRDKSLKRDNNNIEGVEIVKLYLFPIIPSIYSYIKF